MIANLRKAFNAQFSEEKYAGMLADICSQFNYTPKFKIAETPVVENGEIVVRNVMKLTLSCDHRAVDGAVGAKFLQSLKGFLEAPVTMLV